ncbi:MAG: PhnA protein [Fusobacteriaceae bacterium]
MAKGYDIYKERLDKVTWFGKELTRRSKSKCELCEATGVKLHVYEVPPVQEEPEVERCIFICDDCKDKIDRLKKIKENDLRFLSSSIWSEVLMVRAFSIYLLKNISGKFGWAEDMLDDLYIDEDTEEVVNSIEL